MIDLNISIQDERKILDKAWGGGGCKLTDMNVSQTE